MVAEISRKENTMKITIETRKATQAVIGKALADFCAFAAIIAEKVKIQEGCFLAWHVIFRNVMVGQKELPDRWELDVTAMVMTSLRTFGYHQVTDVPVVQVGEITILEDGKIAWHSPLEAMAPGEDVDMTNRLVQSISTGKYGQYGYLFNHFPVLE
jgi:hypothetical protein